MFERIAVARRELGGALAGGFAAGFRSGFGSPFLSAISFGETKEMAPSAARKRLENGVREADTSWWVTPPFPRAATLAALGQQLTHPTKPHKPAASMGIHPKPRSREPR